MNGELVGAWSRTRTGGHRLTYEETWLRSPRRRSLSLSLPIGPSREITGAPVSSFFENLLPETTVSVVGSARAFAPVAPKRLNC